MAAEARRTWRGQTPEQRVAERREKLVDAALDVFAAESFHGSKVKDICRRAGLTERYFYESFSDKQALLEALADRISTDFVAAAGPSIALLPTDLPGAIRGAARAVVVSMTDDPRRAQILFVEMVGVSPRIEQLRRDWIGSLAELVQGTSSILLGPWAQESIQVELAARALVGAVQELLIAFSRGELELDQEVLIESVTDLLFRARDALVSIPPTSEAPRHAPADLP